MLYLRSYEKLTAPLLGLLTASPAPQSQQAIESPSEDIIVGAWSDPARCNVKNAKHVTFDEVVKSGSSLNGQCVKVEGYWTARALFGRAAHANRQNSNVVRALRHKRVGIYGRERMLLHAPQRATRYTIVGVVGQCETEWPNAMIVLGYCHYTGGPIIKVAETIVAKIRSVR